MSYKILDTGEAGYLGSTLVSLEAGIVELIKGYIMIKNSLYGNV